MGVLLVGCQRSELPVFGRLVKFKREAGSAGDRDYHLVVSDDTLIFTDDNVGTPAGHSVVSEIPDPNCIPGQHGNPAVPSRFINEITAARAKLEAQFPNLDASGNWNDAGGISVRIVGVGFFDFPHHQAGRALNNIELHPILEIEFNPSTIPPPTPSTGDNLLHNGGFEDGSTAWVATANVITGDAGETRPRWNHEGVAGRLRYHPYRYPLPASDLLEELTEAVEDALSQLGFDIDGILFLVDEADKRAVTAHLGEFVKLFTERLIKRGCNKTCLGQIERSEPALFPRLDFILPTSLSVQPYVQPPRHHGPFSELVQAVVAAREAQ